MDYNRTLEIVLNALLGGGGVAALITAIRSYKARKRGLSRDEKVATSQVPLTPPTTEVQVAPTPHLGTPDWEALTRYWQNELLALRVEFAEHRKRCSAEHRADEAHIDLLEAHIWQGKPPPPPPRRRHKERQEGD